MDAVKYKRGAVPREVIALRLCELYHCGPWELERVDGVTAYRHLVLRGMLREIEKL